MRSERVKTASEDQQPPPIPDGSVGKESACNAGDTGSTPGLGRSSRGENSLQYPCLESPMARGAWQATVQRVTKSHTPLSN